MGMGTRLYLLLGEDGDETKVWYLLDLNMGTGMNFFYENEYEIAKLVPALSVTIPSVNQESTQVKIIAN